MALLLETIRNLNVTSIYGRRLGLTVGGTALQRDYYSDFLVGHKGSMDVIEDLTTVPTTCLPYGVSRILATGSTQGPVQYFLPVPIPGLTKVISLGTTSTGSFQFLSTANGAAIKTASDGTTKGVINFIGQGGTAILKAMSSAIWQVMGGMSVSSTTVVANIQFTTAT